MKWNVFFVTSFMIMTLSSCGKDELSSKSNTSSSNGVSASGALSCLAVNTSNYSGCCSSHNGARSCGNSSYQFNSSGKLVCNDGTVSPSCSYGK